MKKEKKIKKRSELAKDKGKAKKVLRAKGEKREEKNGGVIRHIVRLASIRWRWKFFDKLYLCFFSFFLIDGVKSFE